MEKHATPEQIEAYIRLFDYNVPAAVAAIHSYAATQQEIPAIQHDSKPLIEVRDVRKEYKVGRQTVSSLNGVSLDIYEGEFVAITGASGSGKSTLLQLMGGLDRPSGGTVSVAGVNLNDMSDRKLSHFRGRTVGFVFQFFYLQPFLSVQRNLEVAGMFARTKRQDRLARVQELATAVGLSDRLRHLPRELSGGQIQRAAIARALLNRPMVLLADEPTGNLDSSNGMAIIELFEKIRRDYGTTIVVVTHDYGIARRADRRIALKDGVIVA